MDLDERLHLRSFVKPDVAPILKAVMAALVVHALFVFNWFYPNEVTKAEMPQWFNVKLIAGFETVQTKSKVTGKKESPKINGTVKTLNKKNSFLKNKITSVEKSEKTLTKATTFIKADSRPYKLKNPKPVYPSAARRRGMQGLVLLSIRVNKKGFVENVNIEKTSGFRVLDQSAVNSVTKWQFVPAKKENEFISSVVEVPIRFQLNDA